MKRRDFIKKAGGATAAGLAATAAFATPAISSGKEEWIVVSAFGKAGLLGQALEDFCKFVKTASDGKLGFKIYHAGELVKPFESLDAVRDGNAQMGFGASYYWAGKSKAISFVSAMPFGLTAQEQNAWCYYGGGIEISDKTSYNPLGLKFLPLGNTGNQMGGWYKKEINTLADLKGLKFRMPGLGGEILKTFDVNISLLPGNEVLPALTTGKIDGTEWIGPAADMGAGLHEACKNYYFPGWHEPATILDSFFDLKKWEKLDATVKDIIIHAAAATNNMVLAKYQATNNTALKKLVDEKGVQLRQYSDELVKAIGGRAVEVIAKIASEAPEAKELYNHLIEFRKGMVKWSTVAEGNFLTARTVADFKTI